MQVQRLMVSNPSNGVVVVTPDADRPKAYLRFEPKGDAEGGDILYVSRDTALQTPFIKAVKRGVLEVDIEEIALDDELANLLRVDPGAKRPDQVVVPSPVSVDYDYDKASASYQRVETPIPVIIEPLAKV
ncbi:hypothetical protein [Streptomyces sp. cg35]|uniref:hypothetical protein n=1 Tax=Streptomyces sp. cg35 TaxID=3421650 RepID=UPI003D171A4D